MLPLSEEAMRDQSARCMNCGIPYCHTGCPVNNQIPDWNDLVYRGEWQEASRNLHSTNNFPEFTGRVCPAPCEASCTLNIQDTPVTIKTIECAIIDRAWEGLAAARARGGKDRQARRGRRLRAGGPRVRSAARARRSRRPCLRENSHGRRPASLWHSRLQARETPRRAARRADGGRRRDVPLQRACRPDVSASMLVEQYDAIALAGGAEASRDLKVPGRELAGVHFAMDFLRSRTGGFGRADRINEPIPATGKHVVVIGGGDTGSDCIGTSIRQGALKVTQLEILSMPPKVEDKMLSWPNWPLKLRTSSSHEEGAERDFAVARRSLSGENGAITGIECVRVDDKMKPIAGTEFLLQADLVLLAMGFVSPVKEGMIAELGVALDTRGNVAADTKAYATSLPKFRRAATCAAANRSSSGRSAKGGSAPRRSTRR